MKIVFAGTPEIAAEILATLLQHNINITACYTATDKKSGRGKKLVPSPVKVLASQHNITVRQPETLKNNSVEVDFLTALQPDLMVVIAYGFIIPKEILAIPKYGCVNIHTSLLPKYRGAAPITHVILNNDVSTGVTLMLMEPGLDTGPIIMQQECLIKDTDTTSSLTNALSKISQQMIIDFLQQLTKTKQIIHKSQDNSLSSYAPKIQASDGLINWSLTTQQIAANIRAYQPWPFAYTYLNNNDVRIKIINATIGAPATSNAVPGTILELNNDYITVMAQPNYLHIHQLQLPGKNVINARDVKNSGKLTINDKFHS